ncbi:hypothetical protein GCM10009688_02590 [Arthrobacter gandavensis]|uniref:Uncharacterized protein n=1 Tax=Arthrobacter gandavensis TaxID=169960 RepID=A0ABN2NWY1_9MICC
MPGSQELTAGLDHLRRIGLELRASAGEEIEISLLGGVVPMPRRAAEPAAGRVREQLTAAVRAGKEAAFSGGHTPILGCTELGFGLWPGRRHPGVLLGSIP